MENKKNYLTKDPDRGDWKQALLKRVKSASKVVRKASREPIKLFLCNLADNAFDYFENDEDDDADDSDN